MEELVSGSTDDSALGSEENLPPVTAASEDLMTEVANQPEETSSSSTEMKLETEDLSKTIIRRNRPGTKFAVRSVD